MKDPNWWIENSLNDLYFLCRNVLCTLEDPTPGYKDLYLPTHGRLCKFITTYARPRQKVIVLMPRGWIKSYIITVGWNIQCILRNLIYKKRELAVVSSAVIENAIEFIDKIKFNLAYNDLLRGVFQRWIPADLARDADRWKLNVIEIGGNRIEVGSVEKSLTSRHFGRGTNDDLVNLENSQSKPQLDKTIDWWRLYQSLLLPLGIEILPGTRWDAEDLYGYLIKRFLNIPRNIQADMHKMSVFEWHDKRYHLLQVACWEDLEKERGSTYPVLWPEERLKEIQREQQDRFGGQYLNDPIAMSSRKFKVHWFQYYEPTDVPKTPEGNLQVFTLMTVDPTGKEKIESDYTGITVADAALDKKVYIRFGQRKLITDLKLAEWIVEVACLYQPMVIGIEETKFSTIMEFLEIVIPQMIRASRIPPALVPYIRTLTGYCVELGSHGRPKRIRVEALTGWIESGRFLFPKAGADDLVEEATHWRPNYQGGLDDILDSTAYLLDILQFPQLNDPVKLLVVPDDLKMSQEEREKKSFEDAMKKVTDDDGYFDKLEDLY